MSTVVELTSRLEERRAEDDRAGRLAAVRGLHRRNPRRARYGSGKPGHLRDAAAVPAGTARRDRRLRRRPQAGTAFPSERPHAVDGSHSQIIEGPIVFHALCEHHALPFSGVAHSLCRRAEIIGISKLTRLVRLYARRFTVQERVGEQIADMLVELVQPRGVAVRLEAAHLCTQMRGVAEEGPYCDDLLARLYDDAPSSAPSSSPRSEPAADPLWSTG